MCSKTSLFDHIYRGDNIRPLDRPARPHRRRRRLPAPPSPRPPSPLPLPAAVERRRRPKAGRWRRRGSPLPRTVLLAWAEGAGLGAVLGLGRGGASAPAEAWLPAAMRLAAGVTPMAADPASSAARARLVVAGKSSAPIPPGGSRASFGWGWRGTTSRRVCGWWRPPLPPGRASGGRPCWSSSSKQSICYMCFSMIWLPTCSGFSI